MYPKLAGDGEAARGSGKPPACPPSIIITITIHILIIILITILLMIIHNSTIILIMMIIMSLMIFTIMIMILLLLLRRRLLLLLIIIIIRPGFPRGTPSRRPAPLTRRAPSPPSRGGRDPLPQDYIHIMTIIIITILLLSS